MEVTVLSREELPLSKEDGWASAEVVLVVGSGAPSFPKGDDWEGGEAVATVHTKPGGYEGSLFVLADNGQPVGFPFDPMYRLEGKRLTFTIPAKLVPWEKIKEFGVVLNRVLEGKE